MQKRGVLTGLVVISAGALIHSCGTSAPRPAKQRDLVGQYVGTAIEDVVARPYMIDVTIGHDGGFIGRLPSGSGVITGRWVLAGIDESRSCEKVKFFAKNRFVGQFCFSVEPDGVIGVDCQDDLSDRGARFCVMRRKVYAASVVYVADVKPEAAQRP